jgi:hypothetical protein
MADKKHHEFSGLKIHPINNSQIIYNITNNNNNNNTESNQTSLINDKEYIKAPHPTSLINTRDIQNMFKDFNSYKEEEKFIELNNEREEFEKELKTFKDGLVAEKNAEKEKLIEELKTFKDDLVVEKNAEKEKLIEELKTFKDGLVAEKNAEKEKLIEELKTFKDGLVAEKNAEKEKLIEELKTFKDGLVAEITSNIETKYKKNLNYTPSKQSSRNISSDCQKLFINVEDLNKRITNIEDRLTAHTLAIDTQINSIVSPKNQ